jgi:hypothetical protein
MTMFRFQLMHKRAWLCGGLAMLAAGAAGAVELGSQVDLHGFGSQDYVQSSDNAYLDADSRGTWRNNFLGLVGAVTLSEKSKLWGQFQANSTEASRFTWFFVDYQLSEQTRVHVGRIKFPMGLYNDTIDTKFLQLSSLEPGIYQGASDFMYNAYTGVGLDTDRSLGSAGAIAVQLYAGENYDPAPESDHRDRQLYGTRVTYTTPLDGLRFMLSFNRGEVQFPADNTFVNEQRLMFSADYTANDWDLKSEYITHSFRGVDANGYYFQAGRTFSEKWTPFVRYDVVNLDRAHSGDDSFSQKMLVAGLGYKVLANAVVRGEAHFNQGYALPVATEVVAPGAGKRDWTLFVLGIHFIF